ncbi:MAG: hypothetical protein IH892_19390 [Planctomycetes bacterium]|nr:hypothetical protein [Planctomycetota bacterium]
MKVFNHSQDSRTFTIRLRLPDGFHTDRPAQTVTIPPRSEGQVGYSLRVNASTDPGTYVLTADVEWGPWELRQWTEAIIEIE